MVLDHREYQKMSSQGNVAILFIHGILGSPRHFDPFLPYVPSDWSVRCLLLAGHGKSVQDFSYSSMKRWRQQVSTVVEELSAGHEKVLVVGHSMGALFAIEQAVSHPEAVAGIFLLAAPLRVRLRLRIVPYLLRVWRNKPKKDDPVSLAFLQACSIQQDWRVWRYLGWIPRFWELLMQIRRTRKLLPQLQVPGIAVQSRDDELVGFSACRDLKDRLQVQVLENSAHFYYSQEDFAQIQAAFTDFCQKNGKG